MIMFSGTWIMWLEDFDRCCFSCQLIPFRKGNEFPGLLIAVAPRYRYCSGDTFTVAVAVAPLLLAESSGDSSTATFLAPFSAIRYRYFLKRKLFFSAAHFSESVFSPTHQLFTSLICF